MNPKEKTALPLSFTILLSREFKKGLRSPNSAIGSTYCLSYLLFRIEAISRVRPPKQNEIRELVVKIQFQIQFFLFLSQKSCLSPSILLTRSETFELPASPAPVIGRVTRSGSPPLLRSRRKTDKSMRRPEAKPQPWKARSRDSNERPAQAKGRRGRRPQKKSSIRNQFQESAANFRPIA